jgi:hypothetical protein
MAMWELVVLPPLSLSADPDAEFNAFYFVGGRNERVSMLFDERLQQVERLVPSGILDIPHPPGNLFKNFDLVFVQLPVPIFITPMGSPPSQLEAVFLVLGRSNVSPSRSA